MYAPDSNGYICSTFTEALQYISLNNILFDAEMVGVCGCHPSIDTSQGKNTIGFPVNVKLAMGKYLVKGA
jgi:hypothetical protein